MLSSCIDDENEVKKQRSLNKRLYPLSRKYKVSLQSKSIDLVSFPVGNLN